MPDAVTTQPHDAERPVPARPRVPATPPRDAPAGGPGRRVLAAVSGLGVLAGLLLVGLVSTQPVELITDPAHPTRVLTYGLLLLAPGAIFWAAARALRLGLFWPLATLAWAGLGALLIFGAPPMPAQAGPNDYALLLAATGVAVATGLYPPLVWLNHALRPTRHAHRNLVPPVRQALLLAVLLVAILLLQTIGLLTPLNALLLFAVLTLAEGFFLSRA